MTLERFRAAQDADGTWVRALDELRGGAKRSHWMWFVFPQLAGLGHSATAQRYAVSDLAEAKAYLGDPVLRERLLTGTAAIVGWAGRRGPRDILGEIDALKLISSLTLFEQAAEGADRDTFAAALDMLADGRRDGRTLELLGLTSRS